MSSVIILKNGVVVVVDDEDAVRVSQYLWCLSGNGHIMRYYRDKGRDYGIYLHHFLVGQPLRPLLTDHINRDPLDNRKVNLRITDKRGNSLNCDLRQNNTSGHTGVYRKRDKWRAAAFCNNKYINLGHFDTKEQAIEARRIHENRHKI